MDESGPIKISVFCGNEKWMRVDLLKYLCSVEMKSG